MRAVWISGLLALGLFAGLACYLAPLEPGAITLQFAFSPRVFGNIVHLWSTEDLLRYRRHLPVDFAFLALYGSFGYLLVSRTRLFAAAAAPFRRFATWSLPVAAVFDAVENAFHWWLTEAPRFGVPYLYAISASCSLVKWTLVVGFALAVAYALLDTEA